MVKFLEPAAPTEPGGIDFHGNQAVAMAESLLASSWLTHLRQSEI